MKLVFVFKLPMRKTTTFAKEQNTKELYFVDAVFFSLDVFACLVYHLRVKTINKEFNSWHKTQRHTHTHNYFVERSKESKFLVFFFSVATCETLSNKTPKHWPWIISISCQNFYFEKCIEIHRYWPMGDYLIANRWRTTTK